MKKVYLFGFSILASGILSAQVSNLPAETSYQVQKVKTNFDGTVTEKNTTIAENRAGGDILWSSDFTTTTDWTAAGPVGGTPPEFGWSIGTTTNSWAGAIQPNMNTTGNFARFRNGNTTTALQDGPFTFTYTGTAIPDLTGVPAPSLQFEQYGARFITLQAVQVSTNGGTTWITVGDNNDITPLTSGGGSVYPRPMTRSFNISAAIAGNPANVMVRLFWDGAMNGPSMNYIDYGWYVDNIRIVEGYSYDIEADASYHRSGVGTIYPAGLEYYIIPTSQITTINFSGLAFNQGAATHTGAKLNVDVTKGTSVFTGTSPGVALAPNTADTFAVSTQYTPASGTGTYDVTYFFDGTNGEQVTANDSIYDSFEVHNYMYARDNGVEGGLISAVSSSPEGVLQIGNVFEIFGTGVIGGAEVRISDEPNNAGQLMYINLYKYDGGAGDYLLERQTNDYTIVSGDLDQWIHFVFETPLDVVPGDDILLVAGHYGGLAPVEFRTAQGVDEQTVLGYIDGSAFYLSSPEAVMIRADMRDFTGITETTVNPATVGQNVPNPFNNNSVITYTLTEASNVTVEIVDVTGKLVQTITPGAQAAGTYTINVNATDLAEGVYFYTFTIGTEKITKQMVVTK